jgi:hypothetical protein
MGQFTQARVIQILYFACLILGCGGNVETVDISQRTRVYQAGFQTVLKAVVDYCNDTGFPVASMDKESGSISTGYKVNEGLGMPILVQSRAKLSFSLKKLSDSETQVVSSMSIEKEIHGEWTHVDISEGPARDVYYQVLTGIQTQLSK